jgi:hypothetical protein
LDLKPRIVLFGNEPGVAKICRELGLEHVPDVARNCAKDVQFRTHLVRPPLCDRSIRHQQTRICV